VDSVKEPADSPVSETSSLEWEQFLANLAPSLVEHILTPMGAVRKKKLAQFQIDLFAIARYIAEMTDRMNFARGSEKEIRASRVNSGRGKIKIQHSLEFLRQAEEIAKKMEELSPGWLKFEPARKALERLEKRFKDSEATAAALIHPGLRKGGEDALAERTPYKLHHPEFKPTPGSQEVLHHAVVRLDDEIQKFTQGKVMPKQVNQFIVEFLKLLNWTTSPANVKTIRTRQKAISESSSNPPSRQ